MQNFAKDFKEDPQKSRRMDEGYFELNITSDTDRERIRIEPDSDFELHSVRQNVVIEENLPLSIKMRNLCRYALPIMTSLLIQKVQEVVNLSVLGHQTHLPTE